MLNRTFKFWPYFLAVTIVIASIIITPKFIKNINNQFISITITALFAVAIILYSTLKKSKLWRNLSLSIIGMFIFAFSLVPLYNVFCDVTGLNGKMDLSITAATPKGVDLNRELTVEFDVSANQNMPWQFKPKHNTIHLHPGELKRTAYYAKNPTKRTMVAQAIPSISPAQASKYFKKVECFCFNCQKLGPGETAHLGLQFYLDPAIPKDIKRLTLSYTLFDITDTTKGKDSIKHHG